MAEIKTIRGAADLAINGAKPAFAEPVVVGYPNIGDRGRFFELMNEAFDRRWLSNNGPLVQRFEQAVAARLQVGHCVAVTNGTIALEVAARALGLSGEVIVPSFTFIATAHALRWVGLTPVFADIDPHTHNLDPEAVRRAITPRTSAVLGVHLWGRPAPVAALQALADEHGLKLLFDAAHAFDCSHQGRPIGTFGACEILSFHATKFFNSFEGGAVVTNDAALADKVRRMCNFGFVAPEDVQSDGTNGKMSEAAAAMGLVNLERVDQTVAVNRQSHELYRQALTDVPGVRLLAFDPAERCNYQYVVVEIDPSFAVARDVVLAALRAENILARKYFWPGCHRQEPYRDQNIDWPRLLPRTEQLAQRVLVLPSGAAVDAAKVTLIRDVIRATAQMCGQGRAAV